MASSNLAPIALAGLGLWWWRSRKPKTAATAKPAEPAEPAPSEGTPSFQTPLSPFVVGSQCTELMSTAALERWLDTTVATAAIEVLETVEDGPAEEADLWDLVDAVMARASEPCLDKSSDAYALAYKMVWCAVATLLITTSLRIDMQHEDVMAHCQNESFDPYRARPSRRPPEPHDDLPTEPPAPPTPPAPPVPPGPDATPQAPDLPDPAVPPPTPPTPPAPPAPLGSDTPDTLPPPLPVPPVQPPPDPDPDTPPNIASPTSREGIGETSLLRLVAAGEREGQTRARPSTVVLALDPEWSYAEQAIAALEHYAREHPQLSFYVVSFWDTQQHFGLPELLGGLKYILSSANPEGIADRNPIIGDIPFPIQPTQWESTLRHATGDPDPGLVGRPHSTGAAAPGRTRGATLLGLGQHRPAPNRPQPTSSALPRPPSRVHMRTRVRQRPPVPLRRFASARLHRRLSA